MGAWDFNPRTPCGVRQSEGRAQRARHFDFNPRTPCGVRPASNPAVSNSDTNFNPRTPCGVRPYQWRKNQRNMCISIHAPLAGCDSGRPVDFYAVLISIHAPLAGCDRLFRASWTRKRNFNPRTPCGVRLHFLKVIPWYYRFQSTHPLRGATAQSRHLCRQFVISIHAPLAGCDRGARLILQPQGHFNPRTPCGVRRDDKFVCRLFVRFQSTHPLRGATHLTSSLLRAF